MMNNKELLSLCLSNSDLERDPHTDLISNKHNATSRVTQVYYVFKYMEEESINSAQKKIKKFLIRKYNLGPLTFSFLMSFLGRIMKDKDLFFFNI